MQRKITCTHYKAVPNSKRCQYFIDCGSCSRPDNLVCTEWQKAISQRKQTAQPQKRDLFGNPVDPPKPGRKSKNALKPSPVTQTGTACPLSYSDLPVVRNLTDEAIASFKSLGAQICFTTEHVGRLWLVPEYSNKDRVELSVDHAATLSAICSAFPGAKVVAFEKQTQTKKETK